MIALGERNNPIIVHRVIASNEQQSMIQLPDGVRMLVSMIAAVAMNEMK